LSELKSVLVRVVRTSTDEANRREHTRYKIVASVLLRDRRGGSFEASLIDASDGGAAVNSSADLEIGETVTLQFDGVRQALPFTVRYRGDNRLNLEFAGDGPLADAYLGWFRGRIQDEKAA
jgi:hypothetical protein